MYCVWNLFAYHTGPCFQFRRQDGRSVQEVNRGRGSVRWRMLRLVCAEWDRCAYPVGASKKSQLGGSILWKIWRWIVRSGEVVIISYQVRLFEDDYLISQTAISPCCPRWRIFSLISFRDPWKNAHLQFYVYFIIVSEIMIANWHGHLVPRQQWCDDDDNDKLQCMHKGGY